MAVNRHGNGTPYRRRKGTPAGRGAELGPAERFGWRRRAEFCSGGGGAVGSGAVLEAPALVAGLDDVAVVGEPVEERGRHLGVAEDARPFAKGEVGGDDDRGALVEAADQMEQQLAAGLGEGQVAELVEDDEVEAGEMIGDAALAAGAGLGLELVDEIDDVEEATAGAAADAGPCDGDGCVALAGAGSADQHDVALLLDEAAAGEVAHQRLVHGGGIEVEVVDVLGQRQLGDRHLVLDRPRLLLTDLVLEEVADQPLRLVLALHGGGDDLVIGTAHAVELELAHGLENFGTLHQIALLRLSYRVQSATGAQVSRRASGVMIVTGGPG